MNDINRCNQLCSSKHERYSVQTHDCHDLHGLELEVNYLAACISLLVILIIDCNIFFHLKKKISCLNKAIVHTIYTFIGIILIFIYMLSTVILYTLDVSHLLGHTAIVNIIVVVIKGHGSFSTKYERRCLMHVNHGGSRKRRRGRRRSNRCVG